MLLLLLLLLLSSFCYFSSCCCAAVCLPPGLERPLALEGLAVEDLAGVMSRRFRFRISGEEDANRLMTQPAT